MSEVMPNLTHLKLFLAGVTVGAVLTVVLPALVTAYRIRHARRIALGRLR